MTGENINEGEEMNVMNLDDIHEEWKGMLRKESKLEKRLEIDDVD